MSAGPFNPNSLTVVPFGFDGKIYRSPMPFRPGDVQGQLFKAYQGAGIQAVVVLVEKEEYLWKTGRDLLAFYAEQGLEAIHCPIPDFEVPRSQEALDEAIEAVFERAGAGTNVAVHCNAGLGRTGTFLACAARKAFGFSGEQAVAWVRAYIDGALENEEQVGYVLAYKP